jgi:hypothetical protein
MIARYTTHCRGCASLTSPTIVRGELVACLPCVRRMSVEAELAARSTWRAGRETTDSRMPEDAGVTAGEE